MFVEMFIASLYVSSTLENCMFYIDLKVFYRNLLDPRARLNANKIKSIEFSKCT